MFGSMACATDWQDQITMTPADVVECFTRPDGRYFFARWGRPIAPVVFGVEDSTLSIVKGAVEAIVALAGHKMAETDPDLGANMMVFFLRDWGELAQLPNLEQLVPGLENVVDRLQSAGANQYRLFRFDAQGAITACFAFVCMDATQQRRSADDIALDLAARAILTWSEKAFRKTPLLIADAGHGLVLCHEWASLIRAAYDPVLPDAATDPAHALRLFARIGDTR